MGSDERAPQGDASYELAYAEGVRPLIEQQAVIDSFRTRAGLLISGAAIATSFFGQASLRDGPSLWSWLAIAAFILLGLAVVLILWPRHDWQYLVRPSKVIASYIEHHEPVPLKLIHRDLALHMDAAWLANRGQLLELVLYFRAACVLLTLEVFLWVVDLVSRS